MGGVGHVDQNGWVTGQACLLEPDNGKEIPKGRVSGSEWAPVAIYPPMHSLQLICARENALGSSL